MHHLQTVPSYLRPVVAVRYSPVTPTSHGLYASRPQLTVLAVCALLATASALMTKVYLSRGLDRWTGSGQTLSVGRSLPVQHKEDLL